MEEHFQRDHMVDNVAKLMDFNSTHKLMLVYIQNGKYTRDARKYLSQQDQLAEKVAMIAKTPYQTLIGNFFLGIYRPKMTIKLFNSSRKAEAWLLQS
jgi:hypothetical protein